MNVNKIFGNLMYLLYFCGGSALYDIASDRGYGISGTMGLAGLAGLIVMWNQIPSQLRWVALGALIPASASELQTITDQITNLIPAGAAPEAAAK